MFGGRDGEGEGEEGKKEEKKLRTNFLKNTFGQTAKIKGFEGKMKNLSSGFRCAIKHS